jgi:hypothetical protein
MAGLVRKRDEMYEYLRIPFTQIVIGRFLFLFISMVLMFVLRPFLEGYVVIRYHIGIFFLIIFISSVLAVSRKRSTLITALVLALLTELLNLSGYLTAISSLDILSDIFAGLLLAYTATIILFYLFSEDRITGDMIMGAICVYFLLGLFWSFVFSTLEICQPGSFQMPQGTVNQMTFSYYSYVTLTTVGYGDMTPISAPARSFAVLEAMMGQLYLAVLIARLVGIHIAQPRRS